MLTMKKNGTLFCRRTLLSYLFQQRSRFRTGHPSLFSSLRIGRKSKATGAWPLTLRFHWLIDAWFKVRFWNADFSSNQNPAIIPGGLGNIQQKREESSLNQPNPSQSGTRGERGIRTPGSLTFNGFQDRRNRPLCHLSGCKIMSHRLNSQIFLWHFVPLCKFLVWST